MTVVSLVMASWQTRGVYTTDHYQVFSSELLSCIKYRVNIPEYIARPTRITRSYRGKRFTYISSNQEPIIIILTKTVKECIALPSSLSDYLLWSLLNLL